MSVGFCYNRKMMGPLNFINFALNMATMWKLLLPKFEYILKSNDCCFKEFEQSHSVSAIAEAIITRVRVSEWESTRLCVSVPIHFIFEFYWMWSRVFVVFYQFNYEKANRSHRKCPMCWVVTSNAMRSQYAIWFLCWSMAHSISRCLFLSLPIFEIEMFRCCVGLF